SRSSRRRTCSASSRRTRAARSPACSAPRACRPANSPAWASDAHPLGDGLYVQYGCGLCAPDGWLNFDASPRLRIERIPGLRFAVQCTVGLLFPANVRSGDIVAGLPVADGTARGVYCSHVLEHLRRDELPIALRNTFHMLAPGGLFRLVVPDLQWRALRYARAAESGDPGAADALMASCALGKQGRPATLASDLRERLS